MRAARFCGSEGGDRVSGVGMPYLLDTQPPKIPYPRISYPTDTIPQTSSDTYPLESILDQRYPTPP